MVKRRNKKKLLRKQMQKMEVEEDSSFPDVSSKDKNQEGDSMDTGDKCEDFIDLKVKPIITKQNLKQKQNASKLSRAQKERKTKALVKALDFGDKRATKLQKQQNAAELRAKLKNLY
eukprot:TRINITY_DN8208_c0_g1_i2.p3 TRINITY_DN8208_c0_g1~~TRINITY_DN8208_c0_g1_i2.p3  ORF type:complete len:117 (+),score=18.82 TRINITY_DN8208_c0_g1_i2:103-453(+)